MKNVKLILVDDHKMVRDGLSAALKGEERFTIVGEASDGKEAVSIAKTLKPDIIVMDINMPVLDGVEAAHEIRKFDAEVKILILTMLEDEHYIFDALNANIDGYLFKMAGIDEFIAALHLLANGETYFDKKVTKILVDKHKQKENKEHKLSEREIEILRYIAQGLTSKEIGEKIFISIHTVLKHRKNILKKLNIHGTAELVKFTIENKIF
jgi:two-component system, NarL family, nitrate/nitrite response regulator NarL